jgi:type II secretory pathway pseudopilin PulG
MEQNPTGQGEQQPPVAPPANQPVQGKSSNKIVLIIVAVVVVLGIIALVGGYFVMRSVRTKISEKVGQKIGENLVEKAIEQSTGQKADVNTDNGSVNIKTDSGTFAASESGNIKLPSDFPSDIFTYSDAKITFSTTTPANAAEGTKAAFMVAYTVNQSVADVVAKYKAEMAKSGWTVESEANYGAMMINFKKATREILLTVSADESKAGTTGVSLTGSEK